MQSLLDHECPSRMTSIATFTNSIFSPIIAMIIEIYLHSDNNSSRCFFNGNGIGHQKSIAITNKSKDKMKHVLRETHTCENFGGECLCEENIQEFRLAQECHEIV